ncbi:MAG TPA: AAA family ATPase [Solirubrobacteraceae bacterium]|jgi:DNA-binding CsgD family transcriptional regulator|nr:AAA family ATPase [Solirubrobacteraceae bacterium]
MTARTSLVGRDAEMQRLIARLDRARSGEGGIVLLSGEAGVGKTRLVTELVRRSPDALVICGAAVHSGTAPYGPVVTALRTRLRSEPDALAGCGPLASHLAMILPELGPPAAATDRPTLLEAVRCALAHLARERLTVMVLDDLHWSDEATLELLSALAEPLAELSVLVLGAYRSDGLPRGHGLRRLRHELRRAGRLDELALGPLDRDGVARLLGSVLGRSPAPSLVRAVDDATQGTPFFVEELAGALLVSGGLQDAGQGLELTRHGEVPLPETVRDAVLVGASELSEAARAAAAAAAVAGETFDLELVGSLSSPEGVAELLERGIAREHDGGAAVFRHGLTREALYADVPWMRRRSLHRAIAAALEAAGAPSGAVAAHWLGARDGARARRALLTAAAEAEAVHAFRDGAEAGHKALELWPEGEEEALRADALERCARCAELAGELADAARDWRELAELSVGIGRAHAQRRLAAVLELRGEREPAFAARRLAADGFAAHGASAEAAVELLAMANQRRMSARHGEAVQLAERAREQADAAARLDLRLRAIGLQGMARAKHGDYDAGLETIRAALAVALDHEMTAVAADLYQRLSVALYDAADLRSAEEALATALDLCQATGEVGVEVACVTCMAYVLRERGEWRRAAQMCRELIASGTAVWVAEGLLGAIHCFEGRSSSARRMLTSCLNVASHVRHYNMTIDSTAALARVAAAEGAADEAREHLRSLLAQWQQSDDRHYAIAGLRWGASFLAGRGEARGVHECADALSRIASQTGHPDALAALACAIGESALLDGDARTAAEQTARAAELHRDLDMPFERAQIELRAGVALAAAGERELALGRLTGAYRLARKLGARPLAGEAAREVSVLEPVSRRLGARAAADADGAGLSRRELEVVRLLSVGRTNREIAHDLFLSRRTVDMHVRNILRKLDCRSRVEAAHRAGELGLLVG